MPTNDQGPFRINRVLAEYKVVSGGGLLQIGGRYHITDSAAYTLDASTDPNVPNGSGVTISTLSGATPTISVAAGSGDTIKGRFRPAFLSDTVLEIDCHLAFDLVLNKSSAVWEVR